MQYPLSRKMSCRRLVDRGLIPELGQLSIGYCIWFGYKARSVCDLTGTSDERSMSATMAAD